MPFSSTRGPQGSIPQVNHRNEQAGQKALFHSERSIALIIDKTIQGGYGTLRGGTILAEGTASYLLVPYITDDHDDTNQGRAFVVADVANSATTCRVTQSDSYKFQVGDSLILAYGDNGASPAPFHDGGAISGIDRTTNAAYATITFTNAVSGTSYSTANAACAYVKAGTSGKFSTGKYILDKEVDTGEGKYSQARGALSSVVMNNAVLYKNNLVNCDSQAITDLGATEDGRFLILK